MSSRILGAEEAEAAQPIEWLRQAGLAAAAPRPNHTTPTPSSSSSDAADVLIAQQRRIQELEQQVELRAREAFQHGQTAGQAAGAEKAQQELEPVMQRLAAAVEQLTGMRRRVRAEAEEDAVRLAIAVARKVLHREVSIDPDALLGLVKAALQRIDSRELHRLRMHPEDIPALERQLHALGIPARLELVADSSLERGALLFETTRGQLDASVATQLAEIERGFVDVVRRSRDAV